MKEGIQSLLNFIVSNDKFDSQIVNNSSQVIFLYIKMFEAIIYLLQGKTEENEKYKQQGLNI